MIPTWERDAHLVIHDNFSFVICIHVFVILVISHFKSLNISLLQLLRTHGTYESVNVGIFWSYMVEETREPRENH